MTLVLNTLWVNRLFKSLVKSNSPLLPADPVQARCQDPRPARQGLPGLAAGGGQGGAGGGAQGQEGQDLCGLAGAGGAQGQEGGQAEQGTGGQVRTCPLLQGGF